MKVFTVGLDEKEKAKQADMEKHDMTKIPIDSSSSTPAPSPPPIIIPRGPPRKPKGCGVLTWLVAAFFVVFLCLTISEIAYNRQRDQAFLRLKWAELRQRMFGYELLSQAANNNNNNFVQQPQPPPVVDEQLAFNRHSQPDVLPLREHSKDDSHEEIDSKSDVRLDFLRALLERMRQKAEDMGLNGDMQVHVIEVKPIGQQDKQRAWEDGFGEVAVPKQTFHSQENDYEEWENAHRPPPPPPVFSPLPWDFVQTPNIPPFPPVMPRLPNDEWTAKQPFGPFFDGDHQEAPPPPPPPMQTFFFNAPNQQRMPFPMQRPEWNVPNSFPIFNDQQNQMFPMPSIGQQNQFPMNFQNQAPIFPFTQQQPQQTQQPWYMGGGNAWAQPQPQWTDNNWQQPKQEFPAIQQTWTQPKQEFPVQPNPAAASIQWVDHNAGQDSPGIDNFKREEKMNGPAVDVAVDEEPVHVEKEDSQFQVNVWQHTQPSAAEDVPPAVDHHVGPSEDKDFLPIRDEVEATSGEKVDIPLPPNNDDPIEKKFNTPFFQVDDPNSFRR